MKFFLSLIAVLISHNAFADDCFMSCKTKAVDSCMSIASSSKDVGLMDCLDAGPTDSCVA